LTKDCLSHYAKTTCQQAPATVTSFYKNMLRRVENISRISVVEVTTRLLRYTL